MRTLNPAQIKSAKFWIRLPALGLLLLFPFSLLLTSPRPDQSEQEKLLAIGKKIFVERCASCHAERGDKPLKTGLPLSQRKLDAQTIASAVKGRLRDKTPEQQRAVAAYIESLLAK
jgi:mono/diheme cytochrome c family protein